MTMVSSTSTSGAAPEDDQYENFLGSLQRRYEGMMAREAGVQLFTTDAVGLFEAFLDKLPADRRQHYTCRACQRFVEHFGNLVGIDAQGEAHAVVWDVSTAPVFFKAAVTEMARRVGRAKVNGRFLYGTEAWGLPENESDKPPGRWRHMSIKPWAALAFKPGPLLSTSQVVAEKLQDHEILVRGLDEFSIDVVRQAHTLLAGGNLYRAEKCIGIARWLLELHEKLAATKSLAARHNLIWLAVADAPAGFCHVRTSMIGTLLEDIAAGKTFETIKSSFDAKMDPTRYQRPQVDPADGNIAQAEKIVDKLASSGALARRFARLEDIETCWKPTPAVPPEPAKGGGVFAHLTAKKPPPAPDVAQPAITMTWEKFARTVLPGAEQIDFYVPDSKESYAAMVTAVNPEAPPILQWDREEKRNPVSWYFYSGGSLPAERNLKARVFHPVTAIALQPSMLAGGLEHQGKKVFFLLEGSRDLTYQRGALFFPETLRSEYHAVRKTMEAYAKSGVISGADEASACGIAIQGGSLNYWGLLFRVTSKGGVRVTYRLDRWD